MAFSKTLSFTYEDLGKEGYLIFTFDGGQVGSHQMYKDYFPVVWRVVKLNPSGIQRFPVNYEQQFLLATSYIQHGRATTGSAITRINFKEKTNLTGDDDKGYNWSIPEKFESNSNIFEAHNMTAKAQSVSVCTQKSSSLVPEPILLFKNVGSLSTLMVDFTPRLRIYSVTSQKGTIIESEVTSPKLWDHVLDEQDLEDEWIITYNKHTNNYEIKADKVET